MRSPAPPLFLHIGRGKSGSSTIQSLAESHAPFMRAHGVICPLTADGIANHAGLAAALQKPGSDSLTLRSFRTVVRSSRNEKVLISAESLFSLKRQDIQHLRRLIGGRETRILCYIRDYASWLQSVYAQATKRTINILDFDEFYRVTRPSITVLPKLERWAEVFGWDKMRIRPLDPQSLEGGDLITDFLQALGVDSPLSLEPLNVAPHWMTLELQRALTAAAASTLGATVDPRVGRVTRALFESCVADVRPRKLQYFTKEQWRDLSALYKADMEALSARTEIPFGMALQEPEERAFLPDFKQIPQAVKACIREKLESAEFGSRIRPDVTALLRSLLEQ